MHQHFDHANALHIGILEGMRLCQRYQTLNAQERTALQRQRLERLVSNACRNSPFYSRLYGPIGAHFSLQDLPVTDKRTLMSNFDDWVTDRTVTRSAIEAFMRDPDHIGRKFLGKYLVFTTSGSTGEPLIALCDPTSNNMMGAINATRAFARKEDLAAFFLRGGKTIGVFAENGFYLSNGSVRARQLAMPWKKHQIAVTSALLPTSEIVDRLNAFQPAMLGGYPSNLELLIDEQRAGRLHIAPVIIMTGGEHLSDALRKQLSDAFGCYVQTSYSCTEGGPIACECRAQHFHINDDWLIIEPVDAQNRPVEPGQRADKLLLTNLYNDTQPFIRYEVTDRVTLHAEPCPCGNPSPWLTLEGRTDDVLTLGNGAQAVKIAPLALYATLKQAHSLRRFQLVQISDSRLELRIAPLDGVAVEDAFAEAKNALQVFLQAHSLSDVVIQFSEKPPMQDASGKFKHIVSRR